MTFAAFSRFCSQVRLHRQTDRQIAGQADGQTDRETDRHLYKNNVLPPKGYAGTNILLTIRVLDLTQTAGKHVMM